MKWHSFIEEQIKQCIEHPAGSAAGTAIFGGIAGMQLAQLLDKVSVRILDYVFALLFAGLASGQAYLLAKALQLLRSGRGQAGSA